MKNARRWREFWQARRKEFVFDVTVEGSHAIVEDDSGNLNVVEIPLERGDFSSNNKFLDAVAKFCFGEEAL